MNLWCFILGIKYLNPVKEKASNPLVEEVYAQIKRDFGKIVEPFSVHSSFPKLLAGVWMASRESELVGVVPRSYKEAVAATVSVLNSCPYCVDAHSIMLYAAGEKGIHYQRFHQELVIITICLFLKRLSLKLWVQLFFIIILIESQMFFLVKHHYHQIFHG